MYYVIMPTNSDLYHHGILGQKWGKQNGPPYPLDGADHSASERKAGWRKSLDNKNYKSTSIRGAIARHKNKQVDKSFEKWKKNDELKKTAIESGKKRNEAKMKYEMDSSKENKKSYKQANKQYKKDLRKNTTYRKGSVREEVGRDLSRKYLSEAKKYKKELNKNPNDENIRKKYSKLMTQHDIERSKARKAQDVAIRRSNLKSRAKRSITMGAKTVATTAAIAAGVDIVNKHILKNSNAHLSNRDISNAANILKYVKIGKSFMY